jgi:hypothetical protein
MGKVKKFCQIFYGKDILRDLGVYGRITLKWMLKIWYVTACTEASWLRVEHSAT